ncbi:casein kinase II subunit alpha-like [Suncus etruscus]|uniref:casein kinase II subunit alpha-like n=1 Tax=Suncus etruscus TaxID=109475 RepID=UPI00210F7256|nr:casein kinase II subunit alpha-like [Suncus etruscus]
MASKIPDLSPPLPSKARVYADVNTRRPLQFWDYRSYEVQWGQMYEYVLGQSIGKGGYGEVFEAVKVMTKEKVAIKLLLPTKEENIKREVKVLDMLRGGPNIINLVAAVKSHDREKVGLVFEYVNHTHYSQLYQRLKDSDIRHYIYQTLRALQYSHSMGIMHRDIKPENILYDQSRRKVWLIDWGMSQFYNPGELYSVQVATRYYKGPELLVEYEMYDYSLDMWSMGCILASLIFQKEPFFRGRDNSDQLLKIVKVLGTTRFYEYIRKYKIKLDVQLKKTVGRHPRVDWHTFVRNENKHLFSPEALDLLDKLLQYDPQSRLTAIEAMEHPFFKQFAEHSAKEPSESSHAGASTSAQSDPAQPGPSSAFGPPTFVPNIALPVPETSTAHKKPASPSAHAKN